MIKFRMKLDVYTGYTAVRVFLPARSVFVFHTDAPGLILAV